MPGWPKFRFCCDRFSPHLMRPMNFFRVFVLAGWLLAFVGPLSAQKLLYAEHGNSMRLVRKVVASTPYVEDGGKLVPASGPRFRLKDAEEFTPVFVTVKDFQVID